MSGAGGAGWDCSQLLLDTSLTPPPTHTYRAVLPLQLEYLLYCLCRYSDEELLVPLLDTSVGKLRDFSPRAIVELVRPFLCVCAGGEPSVVGGQAEGFLAVRRCGSTGFGGGKS